MLSRARQVEVMASTSGAMTASTFQLFLIAVLAATLIDELDIERWQLGMLGAVNTGVGALVAPRLGRVADGLGAGRSMVMLFAISGAGLLATAAAPDFGWMVAASALSGLPQGAGNPVTNKVITQQVPLAQQNLVMGVKQSGVQFAVFLAGATMPSAAATFGWRWAVAIAGVVLFGLAVVVALRAQLPVVEEIEQPAPTPVSSAASGPAAVVADEASGPGSRSVPAGLSTKGFVNQVALYAFLMGLCAGGVTRFYPLYANEVLGYSERVAGISVSIAGVAAIAARVLWARWVDGPIGLRPALVVMALGGVASVGALYGAESDLAWLLWPGVVGMAFTIAAWNVVAMLAVIRSVPRAHAGGATGVVLMGFLGGLTIAAPLVGTRSIGSVPTDRLGGFWPSWPWPLRWPFPAAADR